MPQEHGDRRSAAGDERQGMPFIVNWYAAQCDGEWEHSFGVRIESLDNPGWSIEVDLIDTLCEGRELVPRRTDLAGGGWIHLASDGAMFKGACSPDAVVILDEAFEDFVRAEGDE